MEYEKDDLRYVFPDGSFCYWFSPQECVWDEQQVKWILVHLDLLLANCWPDSPKDEDCWMIKVNKSKMSSSQTPRSIAIEVEARLAETGQDGDICRTFYYRKISYDELARLLVMPVEEVERRVNQVIKYISGWSRKKRSYKEFIGHRRKKINSQNGKKL